MRRWGSFAVAAIAVGGNILLGAIAAAQNAQLIPAIIPQRFLQPDYLLAGFGVALFFVYLAAKATHPAPGAVRLRCHLGATFAIQAENIGESEATDVRVASIEIDDVPWTVHFGKLGSIPPRSSTVEAPILTIASRDRAQPCERCRDAGRPRNFVEFLITASSHLEHMLEKKEQLTSSEIKYSIWKASDLPTTFAIALPVRFHDGYRDEEAYHFLQVDQAGSEIKRATCVYERMSPHNDEAWLIDPEGQK